MSEDFDLDRLVGEMGAEVQEGPAIYRPSRFWELMASVNEQQLSDRGLKAFKRTVNQNYFNWLVSNPRDPQYRALIKDWLRHPVPGVAAARLVDWAGIEHVQNKGIFARRKARLGYAVFVAMLWEYARRRDIRGWLNTTEPAIGDPILVRHRGRMISQDLANSVIELCSMAEAFPFGIPEGATVVELGGGYGRMGWLMLSVLPGIRYISVDIPPALAVAQEYLTSLFPDLPVARFERGTRHLPSARENARMAFLTPNQLEALEPLGADLFVNISSLHEMRPDQIASYFDLIDRHTAGVFYSKQWINSVNPYDDVTVPQSAYPVPDHWVRIFERSHPVQVHFFEAAYGVGQRDLESGARVASPKRSRT